MALLIICPTCKGKRELRKVMIIRKNCGTCKGVGKIEVGHKTKIDYLKAR